MNALIAGPITAARRWLRARPRAADAALACGLTAMALLLRLGEALPAHTVTAAALVVLLLAQAVPLLWRRSHPWPVMAVVGVAYPLFELTDPLVAFHDGLYVLCAAYAVARYARPPRSAAAIGAAAAAIAVPEVAGPWLSLPVPREPVAGPVEAVLIVAVVAGAWLLGFSQRHIHADAARLRELAGRLRAEQETSARRAVLAERARIARDLHDLVAHHVSAIAMQARATAEVLTEDPGLAGRGVAGIGEAADTALTEMRRLLCLLADDRDCDPAGLLADGRDGSGRSGPFTGDRGGTGPAPEPSLRHLERLAATARAAGCRVGIEAVPVAGIPLAVQVSAYRVVQEALTNVLRHAGATGVRITLDRGRGRLAVVVGNDPPAPAHVPLPGSGLGLVGMRERVALFDGTLRAGPRDGGGWRVEAVFRFPEPLPPHEDSAGDAVVTGPQGAA
ncbi:sensor histidine kinase [Planobispora siamensis]